MISGLSNRGSESVGFAGLFNLNENNHHTLIVSDFDLPVSARQQLVREASNCQRTMLHIKTLRELENTFIDHNCTDLYISVLALLNSHSSLDVVHQFFDSRIVRGDFCRVELPCREMGFIPLHVETLLDVILRADYGEQDAISNLFFELLGIKVPYVVAITTANGSKLDIHDSISWFDLSGQLSNQEKRILPGGEVTYTGSAISGTITIDGALLATPQTASAAIEALQLMQFSRHLNDAPITLYIERGRVIRIESLGSSSNVFLDHLRKTEYTLVTEVGLSFNSACSFIHEWSCAANEGRPGVHIGLAGEPDIRQRLHNRTSVEVVHLDLMTQNATVFVNNKLFARFS